MKIMSNAAEPVGTRVRGGVKPSTLITLIILAIIGYSAYKLIPPYVRYAQIKYIFKEHAARAKIDTEDKIRRKIWGRLEGIEAIWLDEGDLIVEIRGGKVRIEAEYEEVIYLPGGYEYSLWFYPSITAEIPKKTFF